MLSGLLNGMLRSAPSHLIIQFFIVSRYDLLMRCWNEEPYIRPTFTDLVEELDTMLSKMTNEVQLNNYYSNFNRFTKFSRRFLLYPRSHQDLFWSTIVHLMIYFTGIHRYGRSYFTNAPTTCSK